MDRAGADRRPVTRVGLMTDRKVSREVPLDLALAVGCPRAGRRPPARRPCGGACRSDVLTLSSTVVPCSSWMASSISARSRLPQLRLASVARCARSSATSAPASVEELHEQLAGEQGEACRPWGSGSRLPRPRRSPRRAGLGTARMTLSVLAGGFAMGALYGKKSMCPHKMRHFIVPRFDSVAPRFDPFSTEI